MTSSANESALLRRSLTGNAVFSVLSSLALVAYWKPLAVLIGLERAGLLPVIGVSLLVYAAGLFRNAFRERVNASEAWTAVAMDLAWVVGSALVIALGPLSRTGNWVVAVVADVVLLFAVLQVAGIRRMQRAAMATRA